MVDFEGYQDVKAGLKTETQVKEITEGTQEQFRTANYFDSFQDKTKIEVAKKQKAIKVLCENGATKVISLPMDKVVRPKSELFLWKKTYGEYPKVGQKVTSKIDENGFQNIVLEK